MKELSVEEKAKAYEEAVDRAEKELNACGSQDCDAARQIFRLFPELMGSGDEKIRKELLAVINDLVLPDEQQSRFIAWLEKLGKNNMGISEATKQELEDNLNKALEKETPESCNEFLEMQGEQKPWSREDEKIFSNIIKDLVYPWNEYIPDRIEDEIKWLKNRLKHLRPQNKQEWLDAIGATKEQIYTIAEYLDDIGQISMAEILYGIHLRNHWKPSDKQMKALWEVYKGGEEQVALASLYSDLKKLKD